MNTPTQDMSHDMPIYSFSIKKNHDLFSLHFDELKLKVQNKFAPMMGFGWTQLQAEGGKRTLLCSSLLWESPGHEVTQGGDCDTRPQGGGAVQFAG